MIFLVLFSDHFEEGKNFAAEFQKRTPITDDAKSRLIEACINGKVDTVREIVTSYYLNIQQMVGKME